MDYFKGDSGDHRHTTTDPCVEVTPRWVNVYPELLKLKVCGYAVSSAQNGQDTAEGESDWDCILLIYLFLRAIF